MLSKIGNRQFEWLVQAWMSKASTYPIALRGSKRYVRAMILILRFKPGQYHQSLGKSQVSLHFFPFLPSCHTYTWLFTRDETELRMGNKSIGQWLLKETTYRAFRGCKVYIEAAPFSFLPTHKPRLRSTWETAIFSLSLDIFFYYDMWVMLIF